MEFFLISLTLKVFGDRSWNEHLAPISYREGVRTAVSRERLALE